jgi:hypothetical protein
MHRLGFGLLLLAAACAPPSDSDHEVRDTGRVCVSSVDPSPTSSSTTLKAGGPLYVAVDVASCPPGCITDVTASCTATLVGSRVIVHSQGSWRQADNGCVALCRGVRATCELVDPPVGEITLEHGSDVYPLAIPTTLPSGCLR